jgi:hypothetical protein
MACPTATGRSRTGPAPTSRYRSQGITLCSTKPQTVNLHHRRFQQGRGAAPALMASVCCELHLVDTMDTVHPDKVFIPSYARSSNRLDYACISEDLLPELMEVGLLHYHDFYPSDHRLIFLGLGANLFGPLPSIISHQFRYVHSNSKLVSKFV